MQGCQNLSKTEGAAERGWGWNIKKEKTPLLEIGSYVINVKSIKSIFVYLRRGKMKKKRKSDCDANYLKKKK